MQTQIENAIMDGFVVFISGMAQGVDIWAAEIVLKLKGKYPEIKLICASPFDGFERNWSNEWQKRYTSIMQKADLIRYVSSHYFRSCFQVRNEWMVDHSHRVIAVFNGEKGGTKNTIDYAKKQNITVITI